MVVVFPAVTKLIIDDVLRANRPDRLLPLVALAAGAALAQNGLNALRIILNNTFVQKVIFDLRMAIVNHLQSLSLSFFNQRKTGDLMSHVTSDATLVHGIITQTIIQVLGQVLTLVGGVTVIFLMNWRLARRATYSSPSTR